jgi:hypothetical protein
MTQTTTNRSMYRMLPGHVVMPSGSGNEPESIVAPFIAQQFTLTFAGADPLVAGDYVTTFETPVNGDIEVTVTSDGTKTRAAATVELAASINTTIGIDSLVTATSNGAAIVTVFAKGYSTDLATPTTSVPGASTLTAAESVAPSAPGLRMGLWYIYSEAAATPYAITGTPRGCNVAALPSSATAIADLRGIVARATSQTELSPTFNDANTFDAYLAGQVAPGLNRGLICAVVDPASGTMTPGGEVHVVIAAGTYSVIGAVANAAGAGAETIRVDNAPTGNILARVPVNGHEETMDFGNYTGRLVELKVNVTN